MSIRGMLTSGLITKSIAWDHRVFLEAIFRIVRLLFIFKTHEKRYQKAIFLIGKWLELQAYFLNTNIIL